MSMAMVSDSCPKTRPSSSYRAQRPSEQSTCRAGRQAAPRAKPYCIWRGIFVSNARIASSLSCTELPTVAPGSSELSSLMLHLQKLHWEEAVQPDLVENLLPRHLYNPSFPARNLCFHIYDPPRAPPRRNTKATASPA